MLSPSSNNNNYNNNVVNNTFNVPHVQLIPYPSFHSSHPPLPLINQNIFLHHLYQDQQPSHQLVDPLLLCRATMAAAASGSNNNNNDNFNNNSNRPLEEIAVASANTGVVVSSTLREKPRGGPPLRKDRHSKIYTAQGLRDRRVRLSIDISRQFFNLQDMLGFDKASQTLGWLLKNSKKAIKELARSKNKSSCSSASTSEEEEEEEEDGLNNMLCGGDSINNSEENEMALSKSSTCTTKESRSKSKARPRGRTKVKNPNTTTKPHRAQQQNQQQQRQQNQDVPHSSQVVDNSNNNEVEGFMIDQQSYGMRSKKMVMDHHPMTSILGYHQQNLAAFSSNKDFMSSYNHNMPEHVLPSMPQNWDANASIHLCTGTHHQVYGKTWDIQNNSNHCSPLGGS